MRKVQTYLCRQSFPWAGNNYIDGLYYTDQGTAEYDAFAKMAKARVASGHFEETDAPSFGAGTARIAATGHIVKRS